MLSNYLLSLITNISSVIQNCRVLVANNTANDLSEKLVIKEANVNLIWNKINQMIDGFYKVIPVILLGLTAFIIFLIMGKIARSVVKNVMKKNRHYNVWLIFARLTELTFILIGFLIALAIIFPSITPGDLLSALGIGTIALSFAFKDILQNYLAGILILLKEPFKIGDEIIYNNFEGTVEFIDTRATFLKSYDGRKILIPNGEIYKNAITVNTSYNIRRSEHTIGIDVKQDIKNVSNIILNVLNKIDEVLAKPKPQVLLEDFSDFTNKLKLIWWSSSRELDVIFTKNKILREVISELNAQGINIPYPTQVVLLQDQTQS